MGAKAKKEEVVDNSPSEEEAAEEAAFLAEMADESPDSDAGAPEKGEESKASEVEDGAAHNEGNEETASATTDEPEGGEPEVGEPEGRVEVVPGYTADEVKERLEQLDKLQKSIDTTNGTLGSRLAEQEKLIEKLQEQSGQHIVGTLDPKVIARLEEEFPELAELLKPDEETEALIQGLEAQAEVDPELIGKAVDERINTFIQNQTEKEQARELRALTKRHPDWKDVATFSVNDNGLVVWKNPAFGQFVAGLPEEDQNTILNSWDGELVSDTISSFKEAQQPEGKEKKKKKPSLDEAVRPKGLPATSKRNLSPEEEEDAAFRKEMATP